MGTDIHMYAEKKVNGKWEMIRKSFMNLDYDEKKKDFVHTLTDEVYVDRNYSLFTVLAGVRDKFECDPIAYCRGLPEDISEETKRFVNEDGYLHDVNYITLTELLEFDWEKEIVINKVCSFETFKDWYLNGEEINIYCASTSAKTLTQQEGIDLIKNGQDSYAPIDSNLYVRAEDHMKIKDTTGAFFKTAIPKLCQISILDCDGNSDNVRIVFGFDS